MMATQENPTGLSREVFIKDYGDAVSERTAGVFIGAGLSRGSGYVDWKGLLAEFAAELELDLEVETDLVSVAQYHLNENSANRNRLSQKIVDEFSDELEPTTAHRILADLPIERWWTTNYDTVVERSLKDAGRKTQSIAASANLTVRPKGTEAVVYKMHGDLHDLSNIVITRDDYDLYVKNHPGFRTRLESDLTDHTFLFLGYSFTDPHFDFILAELRRLHGDQTRTHYAIMKREALVDDDERSRYAVLKQGYRIKDLQRYGIQTVLVDSHEEIPELLDRLRQRYLRRQVFVAGAQHDDPAESPRAASFAQTLGAKLMTANYNVVSGFGLGVGGSVVLGALGQLYQTLDPRIDRRLLLRPFPQDVSHAERAALYTKYRESMLATVGFCVVIAGSKITDGETVRSNGVDEEVDIANAKKAFVIPIGRTGYIAKELWDDYGQRREEIYGRSLNSNDWALLNDSNATDEDVANAVVRIMDHLRPA